MLGTAAPPLVRADAPPELIAVVSELLAKDPHARPADAATVAQRLDTLRRQAVPPEEPAAPSTVDASGAPPAFDDFARATPPPSPTAPLPHGKPILVFGPKAPSWRTGRKALLSAAAGVVALLAAAGAVLLVSQPDELADPTPPAQTATAGPAPSPTPAGRLELADPTDRGDVVELSWRSSEPMDFAVVVAAEGERAKVLFVQRNTSHRVPVDPVRRYCFRIQGTDGTHVVESEAKPIRGARCVT
ncbi:hypothetical protein [Phytohabitans rumicis]|uniref:Uncharacterized protein n=1 Tax=Phytohabitans rumicis TaxID=1076125 RepID=A0A6V8LDP2_9ACTN|nr:hypothetical protein [Phytohabitans rumicis]GFJ95353.1 hypothetical protein Prum_089950 [Phytohabitans rumicis]